MLENKGAHTFETYLSNISSPIYLQEKEPHKHLKHVLVFNPKPKVANHQNHSEIFLYKNIFVIYSVSLKIIVNALKDLYQTLSFLLTSHPSLTPCP